MIASSTPFHTNIVGDSTIAQIGEADREILYSTLDGSTYLRRRYKCEEVDRERDIDRKAEISRPSIRRQNRLGYIDGKT